MLVRTWQAKRSREVKPVDRGHLASRPSDAEGNRYQYLYLWAEDYSVDSLSCWDLMHSSQHLDGTADSFGKVQSMVVGHSYPQMLHYLSSRGTISV
jgi:hypothetical protein